MFRYDKDMERVMQAKKREVIKELETHKERLLKELSSVDKMTLTRLRQVIADYNKIEANIEKVTKENVSRVLECENNVQACKELVDSWNDKIIECEKIVSSCENITATWNSKINNCTTLVDGCVTKVNENTEAVNSLKTSYNEINEKLATVGTKKRFIVIGDSDFIDNNENYNSWVYYFKTFGNLSNEDVLIKSAINTMLYSTDETSTTFIKLLQELAEEIENKESITDIVILSGVSDKFIETEDNMGMGNAINTLINYVHSNFTNAIIHIFSVGAISTHMLGNSDAELTHGVAIKNFYEGYNGRIDFKILRGWAIRRTRCNIDEMYNGKTIPSRDGMTYLAKNILSSLFNYGNFLKVDKVDFTLAPYFEQSTVSGYIIDDGEKLTLKIPARQLKPSVENPSGFLSGNPSIIFKLPEYVGYLIPSNYDFSRKMRDVSTIYIEGATNKFNTKFAIKNEIQTGYLSGTIPTGNLNIIVTVIDCPVSSWVGGNFNFPDIELTVPYNY